MKGRELDTKYILIIGLLILIACFIGLPSYIISLPIACGLMATYLIYSYSVLSSRLGVDKPIESGYCATVLTCIFAAILLIPIGILRVIGSLLLILGVTNFITLIMLSIATILGTYLTLRKIHRLNFEHVLVSVMVLSFFITIIVYVSFVLWNSDPYTIITHGKYYSGYDRSYYMLTFMKVYLAGLIGGTFAWNGDRSKNVHEVPIQDSILVQPNDCGKEINPILANEKCYDEASKIALNIVEIREYLIRKAQQKKLIKYATFRDDLKLEHTIQTFNPLKQISKDCIERREPLLSALVVNDNGLPGEGFFDKKTRAYLGYDGPSTGPDAKEIHHKELNKVSNWNW